MSRFLSALVSCLIACTAYAQEGGANNAPPAEPVSMVWVIVFGVLFTGMIAGFFAYLWWQEQHRKDGDEA